MKLSPLDRFMKKIEPCPTTGCWLWTGTLNAKLYGGVRLEGKTIRAHRASWKFYKGSIPNDFYVLHRCNIPLCVNPDHLYLGTALDNANQRDLEGRLLPHKGENNGSSKLTEDNVLKIRNDERSTRRIAKEYNMSQSQVWRIKSKQSWRFL